MKIAIISDTHDNLATLDKFLDFIKKNPADAVIHCGDIASGETLAKLAKNFDKTILAALGNMDYRDSIEAAAQKFPEQVKLFKDFGNAEFDGLRVGFCHHKETGIKFMPGRKLDYIFYGHTHKPWLEEINGCQFANPGTLAGMFYQATFAILDTGKKKLELKIVSRL